MPNPFRASYHFLTSALDQDQVPSEIRRSLEFVRTCEQDLQLLIELRNEYLPLLEQQPKALERVHSIIEAAQAGLAEVCELVERCRPEAHRGRTPLTSRMAWFLVDSNDFRSHGFVISQHHNTVLTELNYLRQMALLAPVTDPQMMGAKKETAVFDNLGLLGDILGDMSVSTSSQPLVPQPALSAHKAPPMTGLKPNQEVTSTPALPQYQHVYFSGPLSQASYPSHSSAPEVLPVNMNDTLHKRPHTSSTTLQSEDLAGLAMLLGESDSVSSPSRPASTNASLPSRPVTSSSYSLASELQHPGHSSPMHTGSSQHLSIYSRDSRASELGAPSHQSPHQYHRSSLSGRPSFFTQHSNLSSSTFPGNLTWANSSTTTLACASPSVAGLYLPPKNAPWGEPIAELEASPYRITQEPFPSGDPASPFVQKMVKQMNLVPVELPGDNRLPIKPGLRRQSMQPSTRSSGRPVSQAQDFEEYTNCDPSPAETRSAWELQSP